jgi:hypothetical protein
VTRIALVTLAAVLVAAPVAHASRVYRDPEAGTEVRIARGVATVSFSDPLCGEGVIRARVRDRRFARTERIGCEAGGVVGSRALKVAGIVNAARVVGHVEGMKFTARRGAPKPTLAQRCGHRGLTLAATDLVRVYVSRDRTIACLRSDGSFSLIGQREEYAEDYYSNGTAAWSIKAVGGRIAFAQAKFDTAASKYGDGDNPMFRPSVVVRDMVGGTELRIDPELVSLHSVALHPDGRVAWAGSQSSYSTGDVFVKTLQDGKVVTLDQGRIDSASLRAEGDGFAWDRLP